MELREVTDANRAEVLGLRLGPGQDRFVSSVADSLEEAADHPEGNPWFRAVYDGDRPVGSSCHLPGEGGPAGFYERLGFVPTGELDPEGEIVLSLDLRA